MFERSADQRLLAGSTRRFLAASFPPARVRELARLEHTTDPALWRDGAALGWTSLCVPESAGGGSISGNPVHDQAIVAAAFGETAAPGPLVGTAVAGHALGSWAAGHPGITKLLGGELTVGWAGPSALQFPVPVAESGAHGWRLRGTVQVVEAASHVMLTVGSPDGATLVLLPVDAPGVNVTRLTGVDLTRRFLRLDLDGVVVTDENLVGIPGHAAEYERPLLDLANALLAAEICGATERAVAMTRKWTADRYSFGRPLAAYQAIKHRMADHVTHLEACVAVTERAALAVGAGDSDARAWAFAARAYTGRYAPEVVQDCVQLHGGIGVTFEHDLHLCLRRATVGARSLGGVAASERGLALVGRSEAAA